MQAVSSSTFISNTHKVLDELENLENISLSRVKNLLSAYGESYTLNCLKENHLIADSSVSLEETPEDVLQEAFKKLEGIFEKKGKINNFY